MDGLDIGNIDNMFDDMLGELDLISQQLENDADRNHRNENQTDGNFYNDRKNSTISATSYEVTPEVKLTTEEDVDLSAMLVELSNFESTLTSGNLTSNKSSSQDSGIGFNGNSLPRTSNNLSASLEDMPQFNTLKRSNLGHNSLAYDGDAGSLEDISRDIEAEKRQQKHQQLTQEELDSLSPEEREERLKAEKMRLALEKLKEARITKLVVKVFNKDESSKTLMVDERMTTRVVVNQLLDKNHSDPSPNWALIEELPSLFMERMFEEHEHVTEMLSYWTRDTTNRVRFLERKDKYALFRNPQHYLLTHSETEGQMAERQKQTLIDEFFSGKGAGSGVPEVEGTLWLKGDSKSWSQKYCVLRQSGLYYSKSGEPKKGKRVTNLACLVMFEQVCIYLGRGLRKKYKSPTDYGFALKHPAIQAKSKHIRYFCCPDVRSLMRWIVGIRIAKYGKQLKENYDKTQEEVRLMTSSTAGFFKSSQVGDTSSMKSSDSDSMGGTMPRVGGVKNVFEGAWQRAQQQEEENEPVSTPTRQKSMQWQPNQPTKKSPNNGNNWWDLQEDRPPLSPLKSDNRLSSSSSGSRGSLKSGGLPHGSPKPLPPLPNKPRTSHDILPPPMMDMPPPPPISNMPPPPPAMNNMPPPPFMGNMPPPPPMDDMPPPPPMNDMPPPLPMDNMPPPPGVGAYQLPPALRNKAGPSPVRLPMLPTKPNKFRGSGPPLPPPKNMNYNNNKPPALLHRDSYDEMPPAFHPPTPNREQLPSFSLAHSKHVPPLSSYYNTSNAVSYKVSDFPPPPPFVLDLKGKFSSVQSTYHNNMNFDLDLPPPPPDLLLSTVKTPQRQNSRSGAAPPPPRRNPTTRLSSKRR